MIIQSQQDFQQSTAAHQVFTLEHFTERENFPAAKNSTTKWQPRPLFASLSSLHVEQLF
jgi:hypothetical protein